MPNLPYSFLRPLLFQLSPETAHALTFGLLDLAEQLEISNWVAPPTPSNKLRVMGIEFDNAVGLAAGLDKNAEHLRGLAALGFGFVEVGTVTPRPQPGQKKPRLFRVPAAEALINRMGFNNHGVDALVRNVERARFKGVLGINIGKNFDTPLERAGDDYVCCLQRVYRHASYVVVNISSPNTQNLRALQENEPLTQLLVTLKRCQAELADKYGKYVPLAVKIAPDLDSAQIESIARLLILHQLDGVVATNTTISRAEIAELEHAKELGGLSGRPLAQRSTQVVLELARQLQGALPIIGVGGIFSGEDAQAKVAAGAALVQLYTGLIYRGPALVGECVRALAR